eukprot:7391933-Lingulodinium_polyedra.AAC.1
MAPSAQLMSPATNAGSHRGCATRRWRTWPGARCQRPPWPPRPIRTPGPRAKPGGGQSARR